MNGFILGIDLCEPYSQLSFLAPGMRSPQAIRSSEESSGLIPTSIGKVRGSEDWRIGPEDYDLALSGRGTVVEKLLTLLSKSSGESIDGVYYDAVQLMSLYVRKLMDLACERTGSKEILGLAFGLRQLSAELLDRMTEVCDRIGMPRERVRFLSHTECFAYYTASQPRETWPNLVVCFDLNDIRLDYYELRVIRGRRPQILEARRETLDDGFHLDLLATPKGARMADTILSSCADRMLQKKLISAVYLTGDGFASLDWAPDFVRKLCNKRKVYSGQHLFADGAALAAADSQRAESQYPYMFICEGRLSSSIGLVAVRDGKRETMQLAAAGSNWYEARTSADFILDDVGTLELIVTPFSTQRVETISISLADLPARPNKTTRIELILSFESENHVTVRVVDKGFGDLFPASGMVIRKDFLIS